MCFHFDNVDLALSHLVKNGWKDLCDGYWESRDRSCLAMVVALPRLGELVQVRVYEKGSV